MNGIAFISLIVTVIIAIIGWLIHLTVSLRDQKIKLEQRTAPYRQALYMKQFEGYSELIVKMHKTIKLISTIKGYYKIKDNIISFKLLREKAKSPDFGQIINFSKDLNSCIIEYKEKLDKNIIFFPGELIDKFIGFNNCFLNFDHLDLNKINELYADIPCIAFDIFGIYTLTEESKKYIEERS